MKISLKKEIIIILLLVLLSIIAFFLYRNTKEDYNFTTIKASELEGKNSENSITYTIIFDAKGGTGGPDRIESTRPDGIIPGEAPKKTGYVFLGWGTKSNPNEIWGRRNVYYNLEELSQEDINADGTVTLYAIWGRQINFHTGNRYEIFEINVSEEGEHTMTDQIPTPSHTGLKFEGWATKSKQNQVWCVAGGKYKLTTLSKEDINDDGTVTLYAVWSHKITLRTEKGIFKEFFVKNGESFTMPSEEPTEPGYIFSGWATKSNIYQVWCVAGGKFNLDDFLEKEIEDDKSINLFAVWSRKVILNTGEGNPTEFYVIADGRDHTMTSEEPTKPGFKFEGWATKSKPNEVWCVAGGKYNLALLFGENVNDDGTVNLYAVWSRKIILNKGEDNSTEFYVIAEGDHTMTSEKPTKPGFKFEGWATKSKPNEVWCVAGGKYNLATLSEEDINDDGTITLIPVWKEDTKPSNPDEGNTNPSNPDEGNTNPSNPNEGNTNPNNPNKDNTNSSNSSKNDKDQTTLNKNNTNSKQSNKTELNTSPVPLAHAGNETKYEKIIIIGILACTTTAIVLYFKLRNANY